MGLSIRYTPAKDQLTVNEELKWCNAQGWRHIVDWRWFHNDDKTKQFHFEDPKHAHWFILRWGGEITGQI